MYGSTDKSMIQRLTILTLQCLFLMVVVWLLFYQGNQALGLPSGNHHRNMLLFACCLFVFIRMNVMIFYLLKRGITWMEAINVPFVFAIYLNCAENTPNFYKWGMNRRVRRGRDIFPSRKSNHPRI
ncbi:hypothetical protein SAMN05444972_107210 [Marininema halotolerans]|uniref:Uncharacterized protein n=1 Tax=Marininema halotolerans TaxID=1155944 RepID=A0A1I6SMY1_9BACL|nr:hypothetical protein SAMN05444972_107210 [Marininema halotolerans]